MLFFSFEMLFVLMLMLLFSRRIVINICSQIENGESTFLKHVMKHIVSHGGPVVLFVVLKINIHIHT